MSSLVFQQYQAQFTAHIRNPKANPRPPRVVARGMRIYAEIVFNNIEDTLSSCFPVAKKVLGVRSWTRLVRAFLAEHQCSTPLFRQIPEEFLHYLERSPAAAINLPPFLYSLAHYEWVELALSLSDAALPAGTIDQQGDLVKGRPVLAPALSLLRYDYEVQRISPRYKPAQQLAEPVNILAFRRMDDEVKFIVLNPVSARLVALLQEGLTGAAALQCIAEELQHPKPEVVVQGGMEILESLRYEQAIWGIWGEST